MSSHYYFNRIALCALYFRQLNELSYLRQRWWVLLFLLLLWGTPKLGLSYAWGTFSTSGGHACVIRNDGSVACWGNNDYGQVIAPGGTFTQVTVGGYHSCGIKSDGGLACWGRNDLNQTTPPLGTFTQISSGGYHTCGIRSDGSVACWGSNSNGQTVPPAGVFIQVNSGLAHTCGIRSDGSIECWGNSGFGQAPPTVAGTFTQVSSVGYHTCGLKSDGDIACWGRDNYGQAPATITGPFTQVSAGYYHTCGLRSDGSITCLGNNGYGQSTPPLGTFTKVVAGVWGTCGIKSDGSIACWGDYSAGQVTPPTNTFSQIGSGHWHGCGIKGDGSLACWGKNDLGQAIPPAGTFTQLSVGGYHACGFKSDGSIICWGASGNELTTVLAADTPTQITGGYAHTCWIKSDSTLACWGLNGDGQASPPVGTFTQVQANGWHTCGIKSDGTVACWGRNDYGQASPPIGTFTQLSAGGYHTCGIQSDGSTVCWGVPGGAQTSPPAETFTQLSAGGYHTCGLRNNGSVTCWGSNDYGQSTPPAGTFTQISAGWIFTCGLKSDDSIVCWGGNNYFGEITVPSNQAPVNILPTTQSTLEDTPFTFSTIAVSDDAGSYPIKLTLTSTFGTLTLATSNGLTFSVGDGTADSAMTFNGTVADINTALNGMMFTPPANWSGTVSIQLVTDDQAQPFYPGIPLNDTDTLTVIVNSVNDPPNFTATNPPAVNEDTGSQTLTNWITSFTPGPSDEAAQTPNYLLSNISNASLFTVVPSINTAGTLSYTLAPDACGTTTFQVIAQDNGGIANGGIDTSAPQTFSLIVNCVPGIVLNPISGLTTSEGGATTTFDVVLASPPTAEVTIALNSSDGTEGTLSPTSLVFNSSNWSSIQTATITGVDDVVADGNVTYFLFPTRQRGNSVQTR